MSPSSQSSGYSAKVEMELIWRGGRVSLGQVAPDWIMARTPSDLAPCDGTLVITVDGDEQKHRVRLPQGMSRHISRTPIIMLESKAHVVEQSLGGGR